MNTRNMDCGLDAVDVICNTVRLLRILSQRCCVRGMLYKAAAIPQILEVTDLALRWVAV